MYFQILKIIILTTRKIQKIRKLLNLQHLKIHKKYILLLENF